jgi:hypothetical protein
MMPDHPGDDSDNDEEIPGPFCDPSTVVEEDEDE